MKKLLSLLTAVLIFVSMFSFTGASAEAINYLPATEEDFTDIVAGVYTPAIRDSVGFPAMAVWAGNPGYAKDEDFWASGTLTFDTETYKYGTKSVRIISSKQVTCITVPLMIPASYFEAGKTYTFQAYIKTQKVMATETGAGLAVDATDEDHGSVESYFTGVYDSMSGTKDWTLMSLTFVAPEHKTSEGKDIILKFAMQCWTCINGTTWFDGLAVVEGDKPVADYNSLVPAVANTPTETPTPEPTSAPTYEFSEEPSAWAKEEILKALDADLVPAHINSAYQADITRSDFCDLIINLIEKKSGKAIADVIAGYANAKTDVSFPDTDNANVIAAAKLGIVNGRASGAFDPNANITRQEAAKMLALAAKVLGNNIFADEVEFADEDTIYDWAKDYVYFVNAMGVMNGTSTTTPPNFSPLRTYTREQSILTVYRLWSAMNNNAYTDFVFTYYYGPDPEQCTEEIVKLIADCGFTRMALQGKNNPTKVKEVAAWADKYGMDICLYLHHELWTMNGRTADNLLGQAKVDQEVAKIIAKYKDVDNIVEWQLRDEPSSTHFEALAMITDAFHRLDPKQRPVLINLFPSYASEEQLGCGSFAEYIDKFVEICTPDALSFDGYHFKNNPPELKNKKGYLNDLYEIATAGKDSRVPTAMIVLASEHYSYSYLEQPQLLWEANLNLVYGCKSVSYFTFMSLQHADPTLGEKNGGLVTYDFAPTEQYYFVQNVAKEVIPVGQQLADQHMEQVYQIKTGAGGNTPEYEAYGDLGKIDGENGMVGFFDDGSFYLMNFKYQSDADANVFGLNDLSEGTFEWFDNTDSSWKNADACSKITKTDAGYNVTLESGEAILLRVK